MGTIAESIWNQESIELIEATCEECDETFFMYFWNGGAPDAIENELLRDAKMHQAKTSHSDITVNIVPELEKLQTRVEVAEPDDGDT